MHDEYSQALNNIQQERQMLQRFITENPCKTGSFQDQTMAVYLILNQLGCKVYTIHKYFDDVSGLVKDENC